ncbi:hypothetical protein EOI86_18605 [Hwanghaeella grinnelliae]|uniref:VPLPA-CTERM sorting domain-containing protein n=1 Tax=Hwanghaeella grinnelliae TaxID=2500179 RepID=A0A3S2VNM4_9PROT|nr:PEP-CTERM sorting domain-containing protein [Hwanghaeella grinnelliae]RVU34852.1 hypothetical protein EOI86_18605 [Hwanghaeella grinnelliae]
MRIGLEKFLAPLLAAGMMVTGSTAFAANWTLNATDIATGVNSTNINISGGPSVEVSVQSGRTIQPKTTPANTQTRGTSGGVNGEIDVSPDFFDLDFSEDVFLSKLTVAWLFPDGEYSDVGNEVAVFETYDAGGNLIADFFLEAQSPTDAQIFTDASLSTLVAGVTVNNIELAQDSNPKSGGVWELIGASIFGDFDTLRLVGGDKDKIEGSRDSDFSFVGAEGAVVVPVPAALPLMAAGLGLLGLARSRRKRIAA